MTSDAEQAVSEAAEGAAGSPAKAGKRYECTSCGAVVICTKAGTGAFTCHGQPMREQ